MQRPSFSQSSSLTFTTPSVKTQAQLPNFYNPSGKRGTSTSRTKTHPPTYPSSHPSVTLPPSLPASYTSIFPYTSSVFFPSFHPSSLFLSAKYWIQCQTQGRFMRHAPILGDPQLRRHWQVGRHRRSSVARCRSQERGSWGCQGRLADGLLYAGRSVNNSAVGTKRRQGPCPRGACGLAGWQTPIN